MSILISPVPTSQKALGHQHSGKVISTIIPTAKPLRRPLNWPKKLIDIVTPTKRVVPKANIHIVNRDEDIGSIAKLHNMTVAEIIDLNPSAGHPKGSLGTFWIGDQLNI